VRRDDNFSLPSVIVALGKAFACRVPNKKKLDKEVFADEIFAVYPLPSAAYGKAFAEGKVAFAEHAFPVVHVDASK
jgi:hypothetical protein